jgi:LCP family protein required for cell wall assembly
VDDSGGLQFVAILGSDARSGNPDRGARADSIHILALDPKARRGTIVGLPRDAWVDIPGSGMHKINDCLSIGGADLCVRTLRQLTGMPIQYYLLTGFEGFQSMVDAAGGVDAYVPYDMNEKNSGAFFQKGWHHMTGPKALSFTRNRHVPGGDLGRSENQGRLMLDALKKFRAETGNRAEVEKFVGILVSRVRLNMSAGDALRLALLARVTAASDVRNVVAPGRPGNAGRASVVFLSDQAPALFRDVAADARADGNYGTLGPPEAEPQAPPDSPGAGGPPPAPEPSPSPSPALIPGLPIPPLLPGG